jgi:hypothetical protein
LGRQALQGLLPPLVITALLVVVAWRLWRRSGWPNGAWGSALGVGLGYAVSDVLLRGWEWPVPAGGGRLHAAIAIVSATLTALLSLKANTRFPLPLMAILTAGASAAVLRTPLGDDARHAVAYVIGATLIGLVVWLGVSRALREGTGARVALGLWGAGAGASVVLLQSGNLALAQLSGALAASMGTVVVAGWVRPQVPAVNAAAPVFTTVLLGLFIAGRGFAKPWSPTDWSFILSAAAVASPVVSTLPPLKSLRPWVTTGLTLLASLGLCAAGVALSENGFDFSGY